MLRNANPVLEIRNGIRLVKVEKWAGLAAFLRPTTLHSGWRSFRFCAPGPPQLHVSASLPRCDIGLLGSRKQSGGLFRSERARQRGAGIQSILPGLWNGEVGREGTRVVYASM